MSLFIHGIDDRCSVTGKRVPALRAACELQNRATAAELSRETPGWTGIACAWEERYCMFLLRTPPVPGLRRGRPPLGPPGAHGQDAWSLQGVLARR